MYICFIQEYSNAEQFYIIQSRWLPVSGNSQLQFGLWWSFSNICHACLFWIRFGPLFQHFSLLKNIWPYWWIGPIVGGIICHSRLAHSDGCAPVCVNVIYGCVSEYVWESKSLLRWPWEELPELLVHKITMKSESDELTECVYVSICVCVMSGQV